MGFRFRKSFNFGPFRTTLSKSGIGWSIGGRVFRYTVRADGKRQKTFSVPGTGLSLVDISKPVRSSENKESSKSASGQEGKTRSWKWILALVLTFLVLLLIVHASK